MSFVNSLTDTPLWVWGILAFFVDIGLKSMHKHVVYIPRLFLMPVSMIILKYKDAVSTDTTVMLTVIFLVVGTIIGLFFADKTLVTFDKKAWTVTLPGSYITFAFLALFCSMKFIFEYLEKIDQGAAEKYFLTDSIISSLFTGYFLGRACLFAYKFYKQR
ncbi:MAG: hypothetical protein NTU89_04500 [Candidatus Dependentiae bacterium]|nr:hypothetical protein [Candidatus Dependentiae bacterium]